MPTTDSAIGWTDDTWNPIHGCYKVSEGCANCYAARQSQRYEHTTEPWTVDNADENVQLQAHHLDYPRNKDPRRIFVNSMSDLFLTEAYVSDGYRYEIFDVIDECGQHAFQALTKHGTEHDTPMLRWDREYAYWPENLWMGVSVENANRLYRIDHLRATTAATKWVSFEPLVDEIPREELDLEGIDWVVIGGESGSDDRRREMDHAWARAIRDVAKAEDIPVFFKQSSAPQPERETVLAEKGRNPSEARLLGAETSKYRELPALPEPVRDARPDLAAKEVVARA